MKVYASLDNVTYSCKPKGNEVGKVKYRIIDHWSQYEIRELAYRIGSNGTAIIPGHLEGGISEKNCTGIQLFMLDFDDDMSFNEVKEIADHAGLAISFAYHTYSSSIETEKFRIAFVFESLLSDTYVIRIINGMLYKIFSACDKQCKNLDRLFWGGKELIYLNEDAVISFDKILRAFYEKIQKNGNFARDLKMFCNQNNIAVKDKGAAIYPLCMREEYENDEFSLSTIIHIIVGSQKTSFFIAELKKEDRHKAVTCKNKRCIQVDVKTKQGCSLLEDFKENQDLSHHQKFALITNLKFINGGKKFFLDVLQQTDYTSYEKWKNDMKYMKNYFPMKCSPEFCPYYENCDHADNILKTLSLDRKVYVEEESYYSLEEASECLKNNIEKAYNSKWEGLHLIKAQTSIGKTTAYIDLVDRHQESRFIIAVPTNILKDQVYHDLRKYVLESDIFITPSVNNNPLIPEDIQEEIARLHKNGNHQKVKDLIKNYMEEMKENNYDEYIYKECEKIINGIRELQKERIILTTHAYLMTMPEKIISNYTIIIDEDILQLQFFSKTNTIKETTLQRIEEEQIPLYRDIARAMLNAKDDVYIKIDPYENNLWNEQVEEIPVSEDENIGDIIYASVFVKEKDYCTGEKVVRYFIPQKLHRLKYIILSATLNADIYRKYFSNMGVYEYEEKKAKYQGKIVQYTYHTLGRKTLSENLEVFDYAKDISNNEDLPFITYKTFNGIEKVRGHMSNIHFGNATGINSLKGKDIGIIGTFYKIQSEYKLVAFYLGADVNDPVDKNPKPRRIKYKNRSFLITTYKEPLLQELHMYAIESEMEQCVGRARLLRNKCTVYLFSSFPCDQAEIKIKNYLLP